MKKLLLLIVFIPVICFSQQDGQDTLHAINIKATGTIEAAIPKAYAQLDSNDVLTPITANTWTKISNWIEGGENGIVTFNQDTIFVFSTQDFEVLLKSITVLKGAGSAAYIEIGFSINGADPTTVHRNGRQVPGSDAGSMYAGFTMPLLSGDYVVPKVRSSNNDDLTFRYGEFEIRGE